MILRERRVTAPMLDNKLIQIIRDTGISQKDGTPLAHTLSRLEGEQDFYLIINCAADDPASPVSSYLLKSVGSEVSKGLKLLKQAIEASYALAFCSRQDESVAKVVFGDSVRVTSGPVSPVLRDPTALFEALDTGEIRSNCAEAEYLSKSKSLPEYKDLPVLVVEPETLVQINRLMSGTDVSKWIALIEGDGTHFVEATLGTPVNEVLKKAGYTNADNLLLGGMLGQLITSAEAETITVQSRSLFDSALPITEDVCVVDLITKMMAQASDTSCQKCVLCREGCWQLSTILSEIGKGRAKTADLALMEDVASVVSIGALCSFGRQAMRPLLSALQVTASEFETHIEKKACSKGKCAGLLSYQINPVLCTGCGDCEDTCKETAIDGRPGFIYMIDKKMCTKCGACAEACQAGAIKMGENLTVPTRLVKVGRFRG